MALSQSGTINETVSVRVHNIGPKRLLLDYASNRYVIEPDATAIVPYFAACYWFGDPRSRNVGEKQSTQYRSNEIARLSVLYGLLDDPFWDEFGDGLSTTPIHVDNNRTIESEPYVNGRHPNLPSVQVTDLADDEKIWTVIEDPIGNKLAPASNAEAETRSLADQVASMQRQIASLSQELANRDPALAESVAAAAPSLPTASTIDTDLITAALDGEVVSDPTPDPSDPAARPTRDGAPSRGRQKTR